MDLILGLPPEASPTPHRVGVVLGDNGTVEARVVVTGLRLSRLPRERIRTRAHVEFRIV